MREVEQGKVDIWIDEIVACLKDTETGEIQGLIGIRKDTDVCAAYIHWACVAPHNNKKEYHMQKYIGVGGHLFAIAADKSVQWGFGGVVYGFAANEKLLCHYIDKFHADYLGVVHQYQFMISEYHAQQLLEVYHYEWNET